MASNRLSRVMITVFVILWTLVFHYESVRYFYLNRLVERPLPKFPLLFPPAGWIMFYQVDDRYGLAEVFGVKDGRMQLIDPHLILTPRFVGFDNIHRNVLSQILYQRMEAGVCRYLVRKFPYFDQFAVTAVHYPSVTKSPQLRYQQIVYQCRARDFTAEGSAP